MLVDTGHPCCELAAENRSISYVGTPKNLSIHKTPYFLWKTQAGKSKQGFSIMIIWCHSYLTQLPNGSWILTRVCSTFLQMHGRRKKYNHKTGSRWRPVEWQESLLTRGCDGLANSPTFSRWKWKGENVFGSFNQIITFKKSTTKKTPTRYAEYKSQVFSICLNLSRRVSLLSWPRCVMNMLLKWMLSDGFFLWNVHKDVYCGGGAGLARHLATTCASLSYTCKCGVIFYTGDINNKGFIE